MSKYPIPPADMRQHHENLLKLPPLDSDNPLELFNEWFMEASKSEHSDPNAMSVATIDKDNMPNVRILLLKEYDENGFVFFTNQNSTKGHELATNSVAALCFHWKSLFRQVRLRGIVHKTTDKQSDDYFYSRHRESQIGSWVSLQSDILESREAMLKSMDEWNEKFKDTPIIPRPPHWGGYVLLPSYIEFWRNGAYRLHDRLIFTRKDKNSPWQKELRYP